MSLASKFRWIPTPTYGACGGARKNCAIRRETLDPLDQLFFDHDKLCEKAAELPTTQEQEKAKEYADQLLCEAISNLTDDDMRKIPVFNLKKPFFHRLYAQKYRKACLAIFQ